MGRLLDIATRPRTRVVMELRTAFEPSWRGGITCRVVLGATISAGDPVDFE